MVRSSVLIVLLAGVVFSLTSCSEKNDPALDALTAMEERQYRDQVVPEERITELKEEIASFRKEVDRKIEAAGQLGVYYRLLAVEYMNAEMYALALEAFEKALAVYPENRMIYYLAGVASARFAKAQIKPEEGRRYIELARTYYAKALQYDPAYSEAAYALSVLFVFELDRPLEAEPLLESIVAREKENYDAMFLLARIYAGTGRQDSALEMYETILKTAAGKYRAQAIENKRLLIEGVYGTQ